jgi:hypothetical protein
VICIPIAAERTGAAIEMMERAMPLTARRMREILSVLRGFVPAAEHPFETHLPGGVPAEGGRNVVREFE